MSVDAPAAVVTSGAPAAVTLPAAPSADLARPISPHAATSEMPAAEAVSIEPIRSARPFRPGRRRIRVPTLALAGFLGAVLFAALSGFGRDVRVATPISAQLDHLLRSAGLAINEVAVSGHRLTLDQEIFAALGLETEVSILAFDVAAARARIEQISWVAEAQVVRVFPDKLRVEITERKPVALWRDGEHVALIDITGRVLARVGKGSQPALPVVAGHGAPEATAELLAALELHPDLARRIDTATRVGNRRWSLALQDGTIIHLPEASAEQALHRLADLERRARLLNRPYQTIDLRRTGLIALAPAARRASVEGPGPRHTRQAVEP